MLKDPLLKMFSLTKNAGEKKTDYLGRKEVLFAKGGGGIPESSITYQGLQLGPGRPRRIEQKPSLEKGNCCCREKEIEIQGNSQRTEKNREFFSHTRGPKNRG